MCSATLVHLAVIEERGPAPDDDVVDPPTPDDEAASLVGSV